MCSSSWTECQSHCHRSWAHKAFYFCSDRFFKPESSGQEGEGKKMHGWDCFLRPWLRLRTKKGLQGGKTIQQRSGFALLWSLMLLPVLWLMPLRSLCTPVCMSTGATHLWLAPTLLLLPGAGTNDSDRPLGLIVVTHWYDSTKKWNRRPYTVQGLLRIPSNNGTS